MPTHPDPSLRLHMGAVRAMVLTLTAVAIVVIAVAIIRLFDRH
jgi:hypothetical protein